MNEDGNEGKNISVYFNSRTNLKHDQKLMTVLPSTHLSVIEFVC